MIHVNLQVNLYVNDYVNSVFKEIKSGTQVFSVGYIIDIGMQSFERKYSKNATYCSCLILIVIRS